MSIRNPKLRAVVSIRNLVCGLSNDWKQLRTIGQEIDDLIVESDSMYIKNVDASEHYAWRSELADVHNAVIHLKEILDQVIDKINDRDPENLSEVWERHIEISTDLKESLERLDALGREHLPERLLSDWAGKWDDIFIKFDAIQNLAQGSSLNLALISQYAPDEIDELTDTILRNMPVRYTIEEADQYEAEYMEAYEQLKSEVSRKKNLWDRFLDVLAGGVQQSPAEKVMMQRWIEGEKGAL